MSRYLLLFTILTAVLAYAVGLSLRLMEAPAWNDESFQAHGEPLMATHDAYFFLAGAKGTSRPASSHEPFFKFTRLIHSTTGISYGKLGFWLPVLLAPFVVIPLAFLAWREDLPEAILPMGIVAGSTIGFFARTRLGYYDHDMLTLFFPALFATGLLLLLSHVTRSTPEANPSSATEKPARFFFPSCLLVGIVGWTWISFYASGRPILLGITGMALVLCVFLGRYAAMRAVLCLGVGLIFLMAVNVYWGMALAAFVFLAFGPLSRWFQSRLTFWGMMAGCALVIFFGGNLDHRVSEVIHQLVTYSPVLSETNQTMAGNEMILPWVLGSVREARLLPLAMMAERSGVTWWLFAVGVVGYLYLLIKRPMYLLFLPLLVLAVGAVKLGARFTMYGGVPVGIGLGIGLALLLREAGVRRNARTISMLALALITGSLVYAQAVQFRPIPVLSSEYAQALLELKEIAPTDSRVWLWWDEGYAAQYYAERPTFGDGGNNLGGYLYPMALIHSTNSPRQAAQVIKMITADQLSGWEAAMSDSPHVDHDVAPWDYYRYPPMSSFKDMPAEQVQSVIGDLTVQERDWPVTLPEQYFVLSWLNIPRSHWMTHFGNWDVVSGQGQAGKLRQIRGSVTFNKVDGVILPEGGSPLKVKEYIFASPDKREHLQWEHESDVYAVYNEITKDLLIMDETLFRSMLVQMLLFPSEEIQKYFHLEIDMSPWVMIYRIL